MLMKIFYSHFFVFAKIAVAKEDKYKMQYADADVVVFINHHQLEHEDIAVGDVYK